MAGVNRTAQLKFAHPGLATTATRAGGRLVIQNDIGTTDAHVIVIHVKDLTVSVTYTDVHAERLAFFQDMLKPRGVTWDQQRTAVLAAGAPFYLATGRIEAADADGCRAYLEFLGSRLVFLIDWNRARKQLRGFLRGPDRLALLLSGRRKPRSGIAASWNWAARGWSTRRSRPPPDRRCISATGCATCWAMPRRWHSCASSSAPRPRDLLSGTSHALIHDRIRVTLATHFSNEEHQLLRVAADHAGLIFELASLVRDGMQAERGRRRQTRQAGAPVRARCGPTGHRRRARRSAAARTTRYSCRLLEAADDAADELEDAAFLLDLDTLQGKALDALQTLADLLVEASQEWIKALGHATQIGHAAGRAEAEDFLTAIDRVSALEHQADDAERALTVAAIRTRARIFVSCTCSPRSVPGSRPRPMRLKHASLMLRDHVLEDVIDG